MEMLLGFLMVLSWLTLALTLLSLLSSVMLAKYYNRLGIKIESVKINAGFVVVTVVAISYLIAYYLN